MLAIGLEPILFQKEISFEPIVSTNYTKRASI